MAKCTACGMPDAQKAHVKDRASFDPNYRNHDFHNIIYLCACCHYRYFDKGLMAILTNEQKFLVLTNIAKRQIVEKVFTQRVIVKQEFIDWKNDECHSFLEAELRLRKKANDPIR